MNQTKKLKINFVLPPSQKISGGPLAILEYANRLMDRGHVVTITTYPDNFWDGENPFPWFKFKGEILFKKCRENSGLLINISHKFRKIFPNVGIPSILKKHYKKVNLQKVGGIDLDKYSILYKEPFDFIGGQLPIWLGLIEAIPECDLNISTVWTTTFPVYLSKKGKPVYFMQHYEEIFYPFDTSYVLQRLLARSSYDLPIYKIANSSWLQKIILNKHRQAVPFSNNGIEIADFNPMKKLSAEDGIIRVVTYSRPEQWKGFVDAVQAMARIYKTYGKKIEWHVFGYLHPKLNEKNEFASYKFHSKLSFHELAKLYATADIALCTSWYESFPLPPLEAMACGTAVVTTDLGTEDYAFHEKNALVVRSRDIEGIFSSVSRLIDDEMLRKALAEEGRKTAEEFDWDTAVDRREELLYSVYNGSVDYDVLAPAKTGLYDYSGCEFERVIIAGLPEKGIFTSNENIYILNCGAKHRINSKELADRCMDRGYKYVKVDVLTSESLPMGPAIINESDIPPLKNNEI